MEHPDDTREDDPDRLAAELSRDADRLEQRSEDLDEEIDRTRKSWDSKRRDPSEAGAAPPEGDEDPDAGTDPDQT